MRGANFVKMLVGVAVLSGTSAFAQGQPPTIDAARFDAPHGVLVVDGSFQCQVPRVWLGEVELPVVSCTAASIQALLAAQPTAATYRLTVSTGPGNGHVETIDFAVVDKSQVGPAGPPGPQGPAGPAGAQGPAGPQGDKGATGATGATGAPGPKGDKGDTGATGPQGAAGPKGDLGPMGPIGPMGFIGPQGATGPQGIAGPKGDKGDTGATGASGPQGLKGDTGATGPIGATGDKGDTGPIGPIGPIGSIGPVGPLGPKGDVGPQGPAGPAGATFLSQASGGTLTYVQAPRWTSLSDTAFDLKTNGGPLLILLNIAIYNPGGGGQSTCAPFLDGVWAGTYGSLLNPSGSPSGREGMMNTTVSAWTMWNTSRVYPGIAAGTYKFDVRCATDAGTVQINAGVASNVSVVELK